VFDTIAGSIRDVAWCERDPYSLPIDRTLVYGWQSFSHFIIHTARFVFYKAVNTSYAADQHDEMNPVDILETLGSVAKKLELIDTVPIGQSIWVSSFASSRALTLTACAQSQKVRAFGLQLGQALLDMSGVLPDHLQRSGDIAPVSVAPWRSTAPAHP